jgi:ethanolamine utilization protein EutA
VGSHASQTADEVRLRTVGIDIGSATSQVVFSLVTLRRAEPILSSRFVVVARETLYASPIRLTPYRGPDDIDGTELLTFLGQQYEIAGVRPDEIDTGAVILTGTALLRHNARAVADLMSSHAGRLVCAAAGHDFEARLAAHGSGAVARSRTGSQRVLSVDIGGGTTKLAMAVNGSIVDTAALGLGSRLVTWGPDRVVCTVDKSLAPVVAGLNVAPVAGLPLLPADEQLIAAEMVRLIGDFLAGTALDKPTIVLKPPDCPQWKFDVVVLSGGVSEYVTGRGPASFGDLGEALGGNLRNLQTALPVVAEPGAGIRATVIGVGQHAAQVSGSTIYVGPNVTLPMTGRPVLRPRFPADQPDVDVIAAAVATAVRQAPTTELPVLAVTWPHPPEYRGLLEFAQGIVAGLPSPAERPGELVLVLTEDLARLLGRILVEELAVGRGVLCLDGVDVTEFDYLDVGQVIEPAGVIPLVIRSLLFPTA